MLDSRIINDLNSKNVKTYQNNMGGSDAKLSAIIDEKEYMIKFQEFNNREDLTSYSNNVFSECISCHIFEKIRI